MKITSKTLRKIIREEIATVNKDAIEDTVMDVLSDEGGAAGIDPIEDALEDLEDDDISLPDEAIEDIIGSVSGVKRHADGDYVDTTQLEVRTIIKNALNEMDRDAMMDMEARERAGDFEPQDLSKPTPIDDLKFVDEEGYGAMMFPGVGFSYSVRENDFEAKKAELKKRYGDDVMISVPDPRLSLIHI